MARRPMTKFGEWLLSILTGAVLFFVTLSGAVWIVVRLLGGE
jgi:hypothetical protein